MCFNTLKKKSMVAVLAMCLLSFLTIAGCKKSNPQEILPESVSPAQQTSSKPKSLAEVIENRYGWNPILKNYYGKQIPDFTMTDINGKTHKLSDYKGKTVFVVIWATWCGPCINEVPHLIALREIMSEDKLAILAISNESAGLVKQTAESKKMTYTVISHSGLLPQPFSDIRSIPSAFFINPDGTLKLATEGSTHLGQMKAIILAE